MQLFYTASQLAKTCQSNSFAAWEILLFSCHLFSLILTTHINTLLSTNYCYLQNCLCSLYPIRLLTEVTLGHLHLILYLITKYLMKLKDND